MKKLLTLSAITSCLLATSALAADVEVTRDNYVEAETSKYFTVTIAKSTEGKVNSWRHYRNPPLVEEQPIVRMNRDTIYSTAIIDTAKGAYITIPDYGDRFVMVQFTDEKHQTYDMVYTKGSEKLAVPNSTKYMFAIVRVYLPNINDYAEIARLNRLQDKLEVHAKSNDPYKSFGGFTLPELAEKTDAVKVTLLKEIAKKGVADSEGMFGTGEYVNAENKLYGAAYGWGGATFKDNVYQYSPEFTSKACHSTTFKDPKNKGFWSFTVYNQDGFMFGDDGTSNSGVATPNKDGTYTIYFGCDEDKYGANNIPLEGLKDGKTWNVLVRQYAPSSDFVSYKNDPSKTIKPVK